MLVRDKPSRPGAGNARAYPILFRLLAFTANFMPGLKGSPGTNTLALCCRFVGEEEETFIILIRGQSCRIIDADLVNLNTWMKFLKTGTNAIKIVSPDSDAAEKTLNRVSPPRLSLSGAASLLRHAFCSMRQRLG